jgi:hypothetical protein
MHFLEFLYLFICMGKSIFVLSVAALGFNMESIRSDIVCELTSWFCSQSVKIQFWPLQLTFRMKIIKIFV